MPTICNAVLYAYDLAPLTIKIQLTTKLCENFTLTKLPVQDTQIFILPSDFSFVFFIFFVCFPSHIKFNSLPNLSSVGFEFSYLKLEKREI